MATFPHKAITYPEILGNVITATVKSSVSLTSPTRVRIYTTATTAVDTTYNCYSFASPLATGTAPAVYAVGSDATGAYITVTGSTIPAVGAVLTFGKPVAVTAGLSSFFLRLAANLAAGDLVQFSTGLASENLKISGTQDYTGAKVTLTSPVVAGSPSIGSTKVTIGGFYRAMTDTVTLVTNPVSITRTGRATDTLGFSETVQISRGVNTSDSISFGQSVTNQATVCANASDTLTLTDSAAGRSARLNITVTDSFVLGEYIQRSQLVQLNDNFYFFENLGLPPIKFTTPLVQVVPPILPETTGPAYRLFRHYAPTYRHVNVFLLSDGTFVQDYPTPENNNANVPYPWNWNEPDAPYATSTNWNGIITQYYLNPHISQVFWGGETSLVSQDLANALRHAGYGAYLEV